MWVYQGVKRSNYTIISLPSTFLGSIQLQDDKPEWFSCRFWFFSILGLFKPTKIRRNGKQNYTNKKLSHPKIWFPLPTQKKNVFNTNKEFLQVAMFSIFLALAAKRKELNVSEQCSCDGLGGKPRWQKPFGGTWRIIPVSKWLVTPIYKILGHLEENNPT